MPQDTDMADADFEHLKDDDLECLHLRFIWPVIFAASSVPAGLAFLAILGSTCPTKGDPQPVPRG
jgi:hypothetical protein